MNGQVKKVSGLFKDLVVTIRDKNGKIKGIHKEEINVTPRIFQRITIKDKDGNIKSDDTKECHSYTIAFLKFLELQWYYGLRTLFTDINNSTISLNNQLTNPDYDSYTSMRLDAADEDDHYGIVIGTGNAAESNTDYALGTKVAHGSGAGQLNYGTMGFVDPYVVGTNIDYIMTRSFYNSSGSDITCYEFGIYSSWTASANHYHYCFLRDLEAGGKTVANGDTMTVQYTLRVGAGFTMAWWEILNWYFDYETESIEDTGNTARNIAYSTQNSNMQINAADDNSLYGIVVGTGDNDESLTDYALESKIAHGISSGQLDYQGHNFTQTAVVGSNVDCVISRNFYNGSGGTITINEVAIYVLCYDTVNTARYFCIIRDKLSSGVIIADTDTGTIQYTLRTNVGT